MRILESPQDKLITLAQVDETGIAFHNCGSKFNDLRQVIVKRISSSDAAADVVQEINIDVIKGDGQSYAKLAAGSE